ncbi:Major facilitator super domain-containing protein 7 [Rhizoclosmatium sp. JEL0117]|nr:Major facilitator super domain-containing protein 7 [Rhizoclosmatium sp. JEL0117]
MGASDTPPTTITLPVFTVSPFRFLVALGVFCANFNNAVMWATYAAVTPSAAHYYNCSEYVINLVALVFQIVFIPMAFPAMYVLDTWGLRYSILIGTWGVTAGALIRWLSYLGSEDARVPLLFLGQVVAAIATPFAFNAPTKVCAAWFADNERLTANTIMSLAIYAGTALALGLGPAVIADDPQNIIKLNCIIFVIVFVTGLTTLFVYDKPAIAPSKSAQEESMPFKEGMKALFGNWQFMLIVLVFGLTAGSLDTYFTMISDYITPYGYTEGDSGMLGIVTIVAGTISSLVISIILDRTKAHRLCMKWLTVVAFAGSLGFYFCAPYTERRVWLFICAVFIGMGGFSLAPIALELGVECTYPVAEGSSAGFLQTSGQFFGVIVLVVSNAFRNSEDGTLGNAMIWRLCVCGLAMLGVPFYNARSKRMELEANTISESFEKAEGRTFLEA